MVKQSKTTKLFIAQFDRIVSSEIRTRSDLILLKRRLTNFIKFVSQNRNAFLDIINYTFINFVESSIKDKISEEVFQNALETEFSGHPDLFGRLMNYYRSLYTIKYQFDSRGFVRSIRISPMEHYMTALSRWMRAVNEARADIISSKKYDPEKASERWKQIYLGKDSVIRLRGVYFTIIGKRLSNLDSIDAPYWPFFEYGNQKRNVPGSVGGKPFPISEGKRIFSILNTFYSNKLRTYRAVTVRNLDIVIDNLIKAATDFRQSLTDIKSIEAFISNFNQISKLMNYFNQVGRIILNV